MPVAGTEYDCFLFRSSGFKEIIEQIPAHSMNTVRQEQFILKFISDIKIFNLLYFYW